jgi:hypothetical protein
LIACGNSNGALVDPQNAALAHLLDLKRGETKKQVPMKRIALVQIIPCPCPWHENKGKRAKKYITKQNKEPSLPR